MDGKNETNEREYWTAKEHGENSCLGDPPRPHRGITL